MSADSPTSDISPPSSTPDPDRAHQGKVRWRRFAAMMLGAMATATVLVVMTAQGALAASFSLSGIPFVITADHLHGDGFEQFPTLDNKSTIDPKTHKVVVGGAQALTIVSAIDQADITNLCQSISLGGAYLKLTAGSSNDHVKASSMVVDSIDSGELLSGNASFDTIAIGQDASTLNRVPGVTGGAGLLGEQAKTVDIDHLRQTNLGTTAASFTLPNLHLSFSGSSC